LSKVWSCSKTRSVKPSQIRILIHPTASALTLRGIPHTLTNATRLVDRERKDIELQNRVSHNRNLMGRQSSSLEFYGLNLYNYNPWATIHKAFTQAAKNNNHRCFFCNFIIRLENWFNLLLLLVLASAIAVFAVVGGDGIGKITLFSRKNFENMQYVVTRWMALKKIL
jgi:hypothetical protein